MTVKLLKIKRFSSISAYIHMYVCISVCLLRYVQFARVSLEDGSFGLASTLNIHL
jgi:hypothetical protein